MLGPREVLALIGIAFVSGGVIAVNVIPARHGEYREFKYSFSGNLRFYRAHWREVRFPLVSAGVGAALLVVAGILSR
jgi:hypothetical protein